MKQIYLTAFLLLCFVRYTTAQYYSQYFDGADTICNPNMFPSSICITIDSSSTNIWQVGIPQKLIFVSAATNPNVIVTDTISYYPPNNTSSFQFTIVPWSTWGILAIQWKQKLDMDSVFDRGIIEFSVDSGTTWQSAFNNPHVYNFYGFLPSNADTLPNGDVAFSGADSSWRDIWLCYDMSWLSFNDSISVRFTFTSDSIHNYKEGWMIDNLLAHITIIHTVKEVEQEKYLHVFPNPSNKIIHVQAQKIMDFHIIETMELVDQLGQVVDRWVNIPTKFWFDTNKYNDGMYFLKIKTNLQSETFPIVINKN
jgi:hypothetical protein